MVIGVTEVRLQHIMVNIRDRKLGSHSVDSHSFELKECHSAGGVLSERLVNANADFLAWREFTFNQMLLENLVGEAQSHLAYPPGVRL